MCSGAITEDIGRKSVIICSPHVAHSIKCDGEWNLDVLKIRTNILLPTRAEWVSITTRIEKQYTAGILNRPLMLHIIPLISSWAAFLFLMGSFLKKNFRR